MIKFPVPLDWFQKKLWRMKYLEWMIFYIVIVLIDSSGGLKEEMTMLLMTPIAGLVLSKTFGLLVVGTYKLIALFSGFGIFRSFAELLEAVGKINERILANFCEEKPKYDADYDD
ncbi:MAG: hypothetical protein AEth_01118 [Candidatus Argoarchaeum ethanivorans]|uniref:Uncharacterized protein n=1 Tax=Candidatus Argoarchaeum ethanivorans TaxID=2608793 RepID=A0A8B3S2W3_9EURY|nr:MAG: hypothetical protein AEth_01118 [Candidatus Argoarchaeum ethanivorans]